MSVQHLGNTKQQALHRSAAFDNIIIVINHTLPPQFTSQAGGHQLKNLCYFSIKSLSGDKAILTVVPGCQKGVGLCHKLSWLHIQSPTHASDMQVFWIQC